LLPKFGTMIKSRLVLILSILVVHLSYGQLEDGLLLHYSLNGNYVDSSPNGFTGTPTDVTFIADQFGNPDGAIELNGITSRVDFPNADALEPDFPISFAVKVRFDQINGQQIVFATDFSGSTHSGAWLQLSSAGQIVVSFGNAQGGFNSSTRHGKSASLPIDEGVWYNVATIIRGFQDIDIYIDCELIDGNYTSNATTIGYTTAPGNLGRKCGNPIEDLPPYYIDGAIDDFWYWDRELTEEEILILCGPEIPCFGSLTLPDLTVCVDQTVSFSYLLEGEDSPIVSWLWELEDGPSSELENPETSFTDEGIQNYTLTVNTESGCIYSASGNLTIENSPEPPDIASDITLCEGEFFELNTDDYPGWTIFDSNGNELFQYASVVPGVYTFDFISTCSNTQFEINVDVVVIEDYLTFAQTSICLGSDYFFEINDWESISSESEIQITADTGPTVTYSGDPVNFYFAEEGNYTLEISGAIQGCPVNGTIEIEVVSPPEEFVQNVFNICEGDVVELDFSDLPFDVSDSEGNILTSIELTSGGTYVFTGQNACDSFEEVVSVNEIVIDPPTLEYAQLICEGEDTLVIGFNSNLYEYAWESGSEQMSISITQPGQYEVSVIDTSGICIENFVFQVNAFPYAPEVIFDFPAVELCKEGQSTVNFPPQFGPYTFADTLIGYTYNATETESVSFTYSDGCYTYPDTLFISVESCLCPALVPNVFTPDEDGLNDFFKPILDCDAFDYQMTIYNRWGKEIFNSTDINIPWRGESPNPDFYAHEGLYVYLIRFNQQLDGLNVPVELQGMVTLIR